MRRFAVLLLLLPLIVLAACDTPPPTPPPPITVVITAVDDTAALADGVAQALTQTAEVNLAATGTVLALGGVSPTPTATTPPTFTPPPAFTLDVTPTRTPTPTSTPTPTFAPFPTITLPVVPPDTPGLLRVLHAWPGTLSRPALTLDLTINGQPVARALKTGEQTAYQQVPPGAAQITLKNSDVLARYLNKDAAIYNTVIEVPPGAIVSAVIVDGPQIIPLIESAAPLTTGQSRLTVLQANSQLLPVNLLLPDTQRALAYNLRPGSIVGPMDVASGDGFTIDLHDSALPDQFLMSIPPFPLVSRQTYLLVLLPGDGIRLAETLIFSGSTRTLPTEISARFINVASARYTMLLDEATQFTVMPRGISDPVPLAVGGVNALFRSDIGFELFDGILGPWTSPAESDTDKIILIADEANYNPNAPRVNVTTFSINPPPSAINGRLRLIHALPGVIQLNLEVRPQRITFVDDPSGTPQPLFPNETELPWASVAQAGFGQASDYAARVPDVYDVRVVLSGTRTVIAQINGVQLQPGGSYDFVAVPGSDPGSARLELIQPLTQVTSLTIGQSSAEVVEQAVAATLTAAAPVITATPTRANTPTPTWTPVATNTPRPSATPDYPPPQLGVDPAPPNTAARSVVISGRYLAPGRGYTLQLEGVTTPLITGAVETDGTLLAVVSLPTGVSGPRVLRLCVDCRAGGLNQEAFAVVNIAPPNLTPTATAQP